MNESRDPRAELQLVDVRTAREAFLDSRILASFAITHRWSLCLGRDDAEILGV